MKTSEKGLALIKKYEGFYSKPYLDPVGIPTIGYGVIKYPNGKRVTMKDPAMTEKQASDMLAQLLEQTYEKDVNRLVKVALNQNQFDALVSFTYNLGGTNLGNSTLLRKINVNPCDPTIKAEFPRWNKAGGRVLAGLTRRRREEADLYFTANK
ncbi:lysozyme [Sphingobacterium corticis]|uniref:Lysozyme n=1 Tax=Sphingobacterium corticis TaxID=1812823 RepID=A0ABW5NPI2_9SPHI